MPPFMLAFGGFAVWWGLMVIGARMLDHPCDWCERYE